MHRKNWTWTILGILALITRQVAALHPERTEEVYSRTFFPVIRNLIDLSIARLPFPTVHLFLLLLGFIGWKFILGLRREWGWKGKSGYFIRSALNFCGALVFFFLVLWGFNYQRVPVFEQLSLKPRALDQEVLIQEIELTQRLLIQLRSNIQSDTAAIHTFPSYKEMESLVREEMGKNLYLLGLNFTGIPRTKQFHPYGFMRRMGIYGIYFPFTGESYIDPSLHPLEKPFTIAHEMAHSYGFTDEGEANFIGWLICSVSEVPLIQYSGQLRLFRYHLNDLFRMDSEAYKTFTATIPAGIKKDLASVRENIHSVQPLFIEVSKKSNDLYLKTQGVKAGVKSYAQLPMLAYAWRNRLQGIDD